MDSACRFFGVSRSGYYAWLRTRIAICRQKSRKTCGCRRVRLWLAGEKGLAVHKKAVLRVMQKHSLLSEIRRARGNPYRYVRYENLLQQDFNARRPNEK